MAAYLVRRVLWLIPVLFVVSLITFTLMHLVPGGPWSSDKNVYGGVTAMINAKYHLNEPVWQQYLRWVFDFVRGDFGPSFKYADRSINQIIAEGLPATVQLGVMAFTLSVAVGIPLGIIAALGHNKWPDYVATFISMLGIATPSFILAILLIIVFSVWLKVLPALGWGSPDTWVLPTLALAGYQIAQIARYTRASMLEVTRKDYVRTAQSKGLRERAVVVRHMIRNALIPVVTILGPILAFLVTGSFIIETFFGIPGIGKYYVQGIVQRDYSLIMAMTVVYAFAVAALNVFVDVLYGYIDPRIRYS
ncbi:MAG TPA: ABC transporter permease [Candidatus Limnocylindria bacterium]|nr:ABC transporter permease [Candidatus Limnocylindria bacterium]